MKKRKARRRISPEKPVHKVSGPAGFGYQVPPDFDSVHIYFNQKGYAKTAGNFYQHFDELGWLTKTKTGRSLLPTGYSTIHNQ